ncbi:hypothetical protein [uncultured Sphingomonas sp.]|uniref:hypothetical protein n=1 Tax=uncultured Sphingomonas sp. TaxID=158754 RepID=UPI0025ED36DF|nr:hypothetical protein [uncultured Sphingomonas sp.]
MLKLAFHVFTRVDYALATRQQRMDARARAAYASAMYGIDAADELLAKLRDPRRRRSRRALRLAVAELTLKQRLNTH